MMPFIVDRTPYGTDRMAVQESCIGDDGLKTDLLPFPIDKQVEDLRGECGNGFWGQFVPIFPGPTPLYFGGFGRGLPIQCGIMAPLADELACRLQAALTQQGQEQAAAHEPSIGEQPDGYGDVGYKGAQQCPGDFRLVGIAGKGHEAQANGKGKGFAGAATQGQRQAYPVLSENIAGTVVLMAVIEVDGRTWGLGRVSQDQRIVDDHLDDRQQRQNGQEPTDLSDGQSLCPQGFTLQEFVISGPMAAQ